MPDKDISVLGIDIAKNIFQLCGIDKEGQVIYKKRVNRDNLLKTVVGLNSKLVALEACGGSNYWYQQLTSLGKRAQLIKPKDVKAYLSSRNKTDATDAAAIAEAGSRKHVRLFSGKSREQQDIQSLIRIRERLVRQRTSLSNEVRGLLHEYGIVLPQGLRQVRHYLTLLSLEDRPSNLTPIMRKAMQQLYEELKDLDKRISCYEKQLHELAKHNKQVQQLLSIPGVGIIGALSVIASLPNIKLFKNARCLSAYLGLVPKEHSSGETRRLLGISKRGNRYVRCILIHGARAALHQLIRPGREGRLSDWLRRLVERRGYNKAVVALANKNARIMWALLTRNETFCLDKVSV